MFSVNGEAVLMSTKQRRLFVVEDASGDMLAFGVLYAEGNVQVQWRVSVGYTAELFQSLSFLFGIESGATTVRLVDAIPSRVVHGENVEVS